MNLKNLFVVTAAIVFLAYSTKASSVTITNGKVLELGLEELTVEFGMLTGSIIFRLGNYTWPATEIWLVPVGTSPSQFKSNNTYLQLPGNITYTTCKTSVYYNSTFGFAFKSLAQILPNGTFCILAYNGTYDVVAK